MRESVRCLNCALVQFETEKARCRRCHKPLKPAWPEATPVFAAAPEIPTRRSNFGMALRGMRKARGLSQLQLAEILGCPRTWIVKLEKNTIPNLASVERLARALQVDVPTLLDGRRRIEAELLGDPILAEIAPYVKHLNAVSRHSLLEMVREMASGRRRIAA